MRASLTVPLSKSTTSADPSPTAMSTKKQVSRVRQVVDLPKVVRCIPIYYSYKMRDIADDVGPPRPPLLKYISRPIDPNLHQKSYNFIPQLMKDEFKQLRQELAAAQKAEKTCAWKDKDYWVRERERIEKALAQTRSRIDRHEREARERNTLAAAKKEERVKQQGGKKAWHMKKSEYSLGSVDWSAGSLISRRTTRSLVEIQIRRARGGRWQDGCQKGHRQEEEEGRGEREEEPAGWSSQIPDVVSFLMHLMT